MRVPRSDDSQEAVYAHFRQLLAQKEILAAVEKRDSSLRGRLRAGAGETLRCAAGLLESPGTLSLVVSLSVVFAGLTITFLSNPEWRGDPLFDLVRSAATPSSAMAVARPPLETVDMSNAVKEFAESRPQSGIPPIAPAVGATEVIGDDVAATLGDSVGSIADGASFSGEPALALEDPSLTLRERAPTVAEPMPILSEAFIVRVGSFRNPSNAMRVEETLRTQSAGVRTDVSAGGLHAVMLGPFSQRGAAEDAAQSVQEAMGLVPQVLRVDQ